MLLKTSLLIIKKYLKTEIMLLKTILLTIKKYFKTEIKSYGDEGTDFYEKEIPKMDSNHTSLAVINLDSALNKDPQLFVKECKYIKKGY